MYDVKQIICVVGEERASPMVVQHKIWEWPRRNGMGPGNCDVKRALSRAEFSCTSLSVRTVLYRGAASDSLSSEQGVAQRQVSMSLSTMSFSGIQGVVSCSSEMHSNARGYCWGILQ